MLKLALWMANPFNAYRPAYFNAFARVSQQAGFLIPLKDNNIVAVLVSNQQEITGRIKIKVAGSFAHGRLETGRSQLSGFGINGKNTN